MIKKIIGNLYWSSAALRYTFSFINSYNHHSKHDLNCKYFHRDNSPWSFTVELGLSRIYAASEEPLKADKSSVFKEINAIN